MSLGVTMSRLSLRLLFALLLIAPVTGGLLVAYENAVGNAPAATTSAGDPDDDWPWGPSDDWPW